MGRGSTGIVLGSLRPTRISVIELSNPNEQATQLPLVRRNSLESTRSYYGLTSAGADSAVPARDSIRPRSLSNSSQKSAGRSRARCISPAESVLVQGVDCTAKERSSASHATSLPPPKSFLSPKSPLKRPQPLSQHVVDSSEQRLSGLENSTSLEGALAFAPQSPIGVEYAQPSHRRAELTSGGRSGREVSSDHLPDQGQSTSDWPSPMSSLAKSYGTHHMPSAPHIGRSSASTWELEKEGSSTLVNKSLRQRNYQTLPPSGITFLLHGRLVTGGDSPLPFVASVFLILGVGGCWLGTTGVWLWQEGRKYGVGSGGAAVVIVFAYLLLLTLSSMAGASLRDPGILPRNLDLNPPLSHMSSTETLVPLHRELRVKDESITVKYCDTCKLYRPPRSSHCRLCGNCVDGIDHHCTYLHTCVGKRNYVSFMSFVIWASVSIVYEVVFSALHFALLCSTDKVTFKSALSRSPGAAVSFALGIVFIWPISALLVYHLRLMYLNSSTIEQIRAHGGMSMTSNPSSVNPFQYPSAWRNLVASSLGRPRFPSWLEPRAFHSSDQRRPNPGVRQTL